MEWKTWREGWEETQPGGISGVMVARTEGCRGKDAPSPNVQCIERSEGPQEKIKSKTGQGQ